MALYDGGGYGSDAKHGGRGGVMSGLFPEEAEKLSDPEHQ